MQLIHLFVHLLCCVKGAEIIVHFQPKSIKNLRTEELQEIRATFNSSQSVAFSAGFSCLDKDICSVIEDNTKIILEPSNQHQYYWNFTVQGLFLGHTKLNVRLENTSGFDLNVDAFPITILRTKSGSTLSQIFTYVMIGFVLLNTFMMGTQLKVEAIKECVRKPIGPVIGFCCQYILMPLIAFGWASALLQGRPSLQFGYFALGCSPGGGHSNLWTILLEGNLDLSCTMTFFSNIAALAMLPFWLFTLGRVFFIGLIEIPWLNILQTLATFIIPAALGLMLGYFKPQIAGKLLKFIKIFTLVVMLFVLPFAIYANLYIFSLFRWYTVLCGMLLPWTGYGISYTVAFLLKQSHKDCRTIAIETGIQNANIAILLCRLSLPEPDSDLTLIMPVSTLMFTTLPLWLFLIGMKIHQKRTNRKTEPQNAEKEISAIRDETKF